MEFSPEDWFAGRLQYWRITLNRSYLLYRLRLASEQAKPNGKLLPPG